MARHRQTIGDFAGDLVLALGGKPSKQSQQLFNAWQRWEGGWTNNAATYNPLNLTAPGSGLPTINSVGVVALPSYQAGISRTAKLLQSGYPAIARAFQTGQYDFSDPALQADFNRWLTGKRTPGMSQYVSKIAGSLGLKVPAGATQSGGPTQPPPSPSLPQAPTYRQEFSEEAMGQSIAQKILQGGGRLDLGLLPDTVQEAWKTVEVPAHVEQHSRQANTGGDLQNGGPVLTANGKVMNLPWNYTSTHETDGLQDEGFTRAIDIMASPGTSVRSPGAGTIQYFHPTGAQGGGSMLIHFDNGKTAWLGHIANGLPGGTRIKAGQQIALISADHAHPHAHWSIQG